MGDIQALKRELEWELSLDSRDLRSHAWYHGPIPRQRAEEIVQEDGDFLVRDCTSQPGNFVLTCHTAKSATLHFVINKLIQQRDTVYERVQFQFEDDAYDSVADLITYYVGSGRSISVASGARIQRPCNRSYPLSCYITKYGRPSTNKGNYAGDVLPCNALRDLPPRLPAKNPKEIIAESEDQFKSLKLHSSSSSVPATNAFKFNSLPRGSLDQQPFPNEPSPPPKPRHVSRDASIEPRLYRGLTYHTSGSDSGNGSGDSVHSSIALENVMVTDGPVRGVLIRNPKYSASSVTLTNYSEEYDLTQMEVYLSTLSFSSVTGDSKSCLDLENYETLLLPFSENKPLDNNALYTFRMMLFENAATIIAHHLTLADLKLVLGLDYSATSVAALTAPSSKGESAGTVSQVSTNLNAMELLTLELGRQFRCDLIERTQCMKLLVAVTILTCTSDEERAETLNKWIQVATEVKTAYGNLFGFCSIVLGINMAQIQSLNGTWHVLRQKFTENAFLFEAKMRPMWKAMNEANYPQAPNTTIPCLLPYVLIRNRCAEDILGLRSNEENEGDCSLWRACVQPWVISSTDDGLGITMSHLEAMRGYINNLATYRQNAGIFMKDSSVRHDELLEDAFR